MCIEKAIVEQLPRLNGLALKLTRNKANAEDLVQSTCLLALQKAITYEERGNFRGWVCTLMYHEWFTCSRRNKYQTTYIAELTRLSPATVGPNQEHYTELMEVGEDIETLPKVYKDALLNTMVLGYEYSEYAAKIKVPCGTAKSRASRAKSALVSVHT